MATATGARVLLHERVIDPAVHPWLHDHRPTHTRPALPFMFLLDEMAQAARILAPAAVVIGCEAVTVHRWVICDARIRLLLRVTEVAASPTTPGVRRCAVEIREGHESGSPVARGTVLLADRYPTAPAAPDLPDVAETSEQPYAQGTRFHGRSMQVLSRLHTGDACTDFVVDASRNALPFGALNPLLLDGLVQGAPLSHIERWANEVDPGQVAFPYHVSSARFYAPSPQWGDVRARATFTGLQEHTGLPQYSIVALTPGGTLWTGIELVAALVPTGPVGRASDLDVQRFARDRQFVPTVGLSSGDGDRTRLRLDDIRASNWFPGTVESVYATSGDAVACAEEIAARDHVGQQARVHPSAVSVDASSIARADGFPLNQWPLAIARHDDEITVTNAAPSTIDVGRLREAWCARLGVQPWGALDLGLALCRQFLREVRVDRATLDRIAGRGCLFLANHQTGVESALASFTLDALTGRWVVALAKQEHATSWLGDMTMLAARHPAVTIRPSMRFFDRSRQQDLLPLMRGLASELAHEGESLLVHVEGTRSTHCRRPPVQRMSGVFIDLALAARLPVVPLRFVGGVPLDGDERLEFPVSWGTQDLCVGTPIEPSDLAPLSYADRTRRVIDAINGLGPAWQDEQPAAGDAAFGDAVRDWTARTGATTEHAAMLVALRKLPDPTHEIATLLAAGDTGRLKTGDPAVDAWLAELASRLCGPHGPAIATQHTEN